MPDVKDRQHLFAIHRRAKKIGLDLDKYNSLKDQICSVELDLRRLRDPLNIHLPPKTSSLVKECREKFSVKDKISETTKKFFERKLGKS